MCKKLISGIADKLPVFTDAGNNNLNQDPQDIRTYIIF